MHWYVDAGHKLGGDCDYGGDHGHHGRHPADQAGGAGGACGAAPPAAPAGEAAPAAPAARAAPDQNPPDQSPDALWRMQMLQYLMQRELSQIHEPEQQQPPTAFPPSMPTVPGMMPGMMPGMPGMMPQQP